MLSQFASVRSTLLLHLLHPLSVDYLRHLTSDATTTTTTITATPNAATAVPVRTVMPPSSPTAPLTIDEDEKSNNSSTRVKHWLSPWNDCRVLLTSSFLSLAEVRSALLFIYIYQQLHILYSELLYIVAYTCPFTCTCMCVGG